MRVGDIPKLMIIYATGYIAIYFLFSFMYIHALKKREELKLTAQEIFETKPKIYKNAILITVGFLSIVVALLLNAERAGLAGFAYFLIGPAFSIFCRYRNRRKKTLFGESPQPANVDE
jgi:hypothetical protein